MTRVDELRKRLKRRHRLALHLRVPDKLICGAPLGQSIDTCPYCEPLRRELVEAQNDQG